MLRPRLTPILSSKQVQPAYICLPSKMVKVAGVGFPSLTSWLPQTTLFASRTVMHLRPPRSEQGRLLLTLHPEKWLPDLDSHQDKRLNRPPCYFDTIWQWLAGPNPALSNGSRGAVERSTMLRPREWGTLRTLALPTGLPPALFRLEDGCLMYSTTAAI